MKWNDINICILIINTYLHDKQWIVGKEKDNDHIFESEVCALFKVTLIMNLKELKTVK